MTRTQQNAQPLERELRRHVVRMCDALAVVQLPVPGEPLTFVTARKLEGWVKSMRRSE
jgi:hypothetical protein